MEMRIPEGLLNELKQGLEMIYGDQLQVLRNARQEAIPA